MDEEEGMALEKTGEFEQSVGDVEAYKRARFEISELLQERCKETVDANNVLARLEWAIRKTAHHRQENAALVEESFGVGMMAFLDYKSPGASPRSTRPR